jgi:5-formyltetrahydrofolate cyclo-ligase
VTPAVPSSTIDPIDDPFVAARRRGRAARASLSPERRESATAAARRALLGLAELQRPTGSGRIGLSRPVHDELDLTGVVDELRARGWTIWLPVVRRDPPPGVAPMAYREWRTDDVLEIGAFGVEEPPDDGRPDEPASTLEVVVAPCVAVDLDGTRVGFGAGYYDRALGEGARPALVVAAAFDVQLEPALLPRRSWDVPADVVVTDRRTVRTSRR